jgi:CubicO group peptidase (beta-lactamase class C family)
LLDAYFYPYDGTNPHDLASVTKSVTTTLIGIAIDQKLLSLDDPVLSFFPDRTIANRDERKEKMTVGDLVSMTSGLKCIAEPNEQTLAEMEVSPDYVQFALDLPMSAEPGTEYVYCSPNMHLLSAILTKASGMSELDFATKYLFGLLGIAEVVWPADPQGFTHGWGDLYLLPRDVAKIGQLWLNQGAWNGKQVVSTEWVANASSVHAKRPADEDDDYGYGWYIARESDVGGEVSAQGRGGQVILIYPALNAEIVITGAGIDPGQATDLIAPALVDPTKALPVNPAGENELSEAVRAVVQPHDPQRVASLPPVAAKISGVEFCFPQNPLDLASLRLTFDETPVAQIQFTFNGDQPPVGGEVGLDGNYRLAPGRYGFPFGLRGQWVDQQTFALAYDQIANLDAYDARVTFSEDGQTVSMELKERTEAGSATLEGRVCTG